MKKKSLTHVGWDGRKVVPGEEGQQVGQDEAHVLPRLDDGEHRLHEHVRVAHILHTTFEFSKKRNI